MLAVVLIAVAAILAFTTAQLVPLAVSPQPRPVRSGDLVTIFPIEMTIYRAAAGPVEASPCRLSGFEPVTYTLAGNRKPVATWHPVVDVRIDMAAIFTLSCDAGSYAIGPKDLAEGRHYGITLSLIIGLATVVCLVAGLVVPFRRSSRRDDTSV